MSSRLPVEINPFRLVEQRRSLIGSLALSRLPRLQDMLCPDDSSDIVGAVGDSYVGDNYVGGIEVQMDFDRTETGLPHVSGVIEAQFDLTCQRCLDKLTHTVSITLNVILVKTEEQEEKAPDGFDTYLVEDDRLFLQDFIEDEILLALPLSVMHKEDVRCELARPLIEALPEDEASAAASVTKDSVEEDEHDNPFATLKKLKDLE